MPDISPEQILGTVNFKTPSVKLKTPSSVPYEEECSTVTSSPDGTEINKHQEKIKNLTIELTALQLFIKEQCYIIKKQLEDMANRKSISSLQQEIDYLREENHAKTQIIKHLTDMKVVPSNSDIRTGACSCKLASTHTSCVDSNYKEPSIHLETKTKSNRILYKIRNQPNKNIIKMLDSDNINEKIISTKNESTVQRIIPRKKRKRTRKIKDIKMARKLETLKTMYPRKNRKLYIF